MHFLEWKCLNSDEISLKFVPKGSINNNAALFQIMAWRHPGDKPLSKPMMVSSLTHICFTGPQWVNKHAYICIYDTQCFTLTFLFDIKFWWKCRQCGVTCASLLDFWALQTLYLGHFPHVHKIYLMFSTGTFLSSSALVLVIIADTTVPLKLSALGCCLTNHVSSWNKHIIAHIMDFPWTKWLQLGRQHF